MRIIFEEDIEGSDFFEVILSEKDYDNLMTKGAVKEFPLGLFGDRNLNVYIRVDTTQED